MVLSTYLPEHYGQNSGGELWNYHLESFCKKNHQIFNIELTEKNPLINISTKYTSSYFLLNDILTSNYYGNMYRPYRNCQNLDPFGFGKLVL